MRGCGIGTRIGGSYRASGGSPNAVRRLSRLAAVEAVAVEDVAGVRWVRLAEPFREVADLCQATAVVDVKGEAYEARCYGRVLWLEPRSGAGVCADHMQAKLVLA